MSAPLIPEFDMLPSTWEVKRLEELIETGRKISYGIVQPGFHDDSGVPIIRVNNIKNNQIVADDVLKVASEIENKYQRTRIQGGELLITLVGSLGEVAIAEDQYIGWNLARAVGVIPIGSKSDAQWVMFYLSSRIAKYFIGMWANTTVQHTLNLKDLAQLPVPMPPEGERKELVDLIGSLDEKIELNRKQNRTLESIAQALFKQWFVDFEFPDENGRQYKSSGGAMKSSELGEIPEGWEVMPLSEVTEFLSRGLSPTYIEEGGVLVLNQRCIRDGWVNPDVARRHDSSEKKIAGKEVKLGDVLVNSTGMGTLGRTAQIALLDETTVVDSHVSIVRADKSKISHEYLGILLRLREREIEYMAEGSTGQTELSRVKLGELPVIVPDSWILERYSVIASSLMEKRSANWTQSVTLTNLRDTLLPKLMSGELRVA